MVVRVGGPFSGERLLAAKRGSGRVQEDGAEVSVFEFSDQGRSFASYSQLARAIRRISEAADVETVAYVPEKALGMTMLGVLAWG